MGHRPIERAFLIAIAILLWIAVDTVWDLQRPPVFDSPWGAIGINDSGPKP